MSDNAAPVTGEPLRVLIVEDDRDAANLMERQLRQDGIEPTITHVTLTSDITAHLVAPFPDVVLSDYVLPDGNGLDVLKHVQEHAPAVPVLIVTGAVSEDVAVNCLRAGASDYLLKGSLLRLGAAVRGALERRRAREQIETLAMMTDESPNPILRVGRDGHILYANPASQVLLAGLQAGAEITSSSSWATAVNDVMDTGKACTTEISCRDNVFSATLTPGLEPEIIMVHAFDITERKRAEQDRDRLVAAIDQAREIVIITDPQGIIQYVNPAFEEVSGYTREEAIGRKPGIVRSGKHDETFYTGLWRTITAGRVWRGTFTNRRKDGTTWEEIATISPVRDEAGNICNFVSVNRDVTDESKLRQQLYHAQKMEAIGTLAGGIAHDFNNILTSVIGYGGLARTDLDPDGRPAKNIEHVLRAARRASELVKQILAFSRQTEQAARPMVVQPLLKETTKLLESSLPSTIEIRCQVAETAPPVMADPSQIHQVIMNLCVNAFNAMRERGGLLDLRLEEITIEEPVTSSPNDLHPGPYLKLTVSDTGCGMNRTTLSHIFEPYFTTSSNGEGTGLGLSTVHGILKSAGGAITVRSEPREGTIFTVYLPVCMEEADEGGEEYRDGPLLGGNESILFVDDETMLAEFGEIALGRLGYDVTVFTKSNAALEVFRKDPQRFDLIITDQVMPGMTGMELAEAAIATRPDMPIILTTGFSQTITAEMCRQRGIKEFVMKPLVVRELSRAIRRALGEEVG